MQINNLIKLYFHVCDKYKEELCFEVQRHSNNHKQEGIITDEELLTIYLFCVAYEDKYKIKSMYKYIKNHWHSWFPLLPSYQAFNSRLNNLCDAFPILLIDFMNRISINSDNLKILLGDSLPVITCSHKRSGKVAKELTAKGFCATKNLHYYGVKIHLLGLRRASIIPLPQYIEITPANVHDLTALRNILETIKADISILDKAYADADLEKQMKKNEYILLTPIKDKKGWGAALKQNDQAFIDVFNKAVSTVKQPIESLFNWINELTQIQNASKVRSAKGLKLHLYGKLTVALMIITNF
ncbi:MAG: transposase [Flavobacterium sp.]|nr:transposase [Flavobacterium sp.]